MHYGCQAIVNRGCYREHGLLLVVVTVVMAVKMSITIAFPDHFIMQALAFGGIPGLLSIYHRWMLEESHAWSKMVAADKALAATSSTTPNPSVLTAAAATGKDRRISDADAGTPTGPGATATSPIADSDIIVVGSNTMHHKSMTRLMGTASSKLDSALQRLPGVQNTASVGKSLSTLWEYRWTLVGTAGNWFLLDITFYGQGLFSGTVLAIAGITGSEGGHHSREQLQDIANGSLMLVAIAMPGYLVATALIERMGRRNMQLMGFTMDSIIYLVLGVWLTQLRGDAKGLFVLLYGLTFFFSNFGANTTTFVIPAEAFPTRARSTCHGLSAASGKLGAVLGSSGMAPLLTAYGTDAESKDRGLQLVMYICCAVSLLGVIWTMLFTVETGQRDLAALDDPTFKPALVVEAFASPLQPLAASLSKRQPAGFGYGTGTSSPVPPEDTTVHVVADAAAADAGAARDDRATRRNRTIESAASDGAGEEDRPASLLPKVVLHRIHSDIDHWHSIRAVGGDDAL